MLKTVTQILPALLSFLGLFSVFLVGLSSHSDYQLLSVMSASMVANYAWQIAVVLVFSLVIARVIFFASRGILMKLLAVYLPDTNFTRCPRKLVRILIVSMSRGVKFNLLITYTIAFIIFGRIFLSASFLVLLVFVWLVGFAVYAFLLSEQSLLEASKFARGKRKRKTYFNWRIFGQTESEAAVSGIFFRRVFEGPAALLTMIVIVSASSMFYLGSFKSEELRRSNYYSYQGKKDLALFARGGEEIIFWDESRAVYLVYLRGGLLELAAPRMHE